MKKIIFFFLVLINLSAISQPGFLDNTFGDSGKVFSPAIVGACQTAFLQRDGKILTAGDNQKIFTVIRHKQDGSLDSSFGEGGIKLIDVPLYEYEIITGIVQLQNGKIIAIGHGNLKGGFLKEDILIIRLNFDGDLDSSFGENGIRSYDFGYPEFPTAMQLQTDGKIVIGGYLNTNIQQLQRSIFAARFLPDGSIDSNFSNDGIVLWLEFAINPFSTGLVIQNDGKILESAKDISTPYKFIMARFNGDGSLDASFDEDGFLESNLPIGNEFINALALQTDGKIIAAGRGRFNDFGTGAQMVVARYNNDGSLDETFGTEGAAYIKFPLNSEASSVAIQRDGKIVLSGRNYTDITPAVSNFAIARLTQNGLLDSGFAILGTQLTDWGVYSLSIKAMLQNDGKILSIGRRLDTGTYAMCRYNNDPVNQHPLITKIKKWIRNHILNFQDANPNTAYYIIEGTTASGAYMPVIKISATTANAVHSYPLNANVQSANAIDYYRIKAVNKDNSFAYSSPISSSDDAAVVSSSLKIYPNPAKDKINIQSATEVNLRLQNSSGQVLLTKKIKESGSMDVSKLQVGVYYIIDTESGESFKMVKE